jgi:septal ring factor EnvC (AmiA/AmiB activator)
MTSNVITKWIEKLKQADIERKDSSVQYNLDAQKKLEKQLQKEQRKKEEIEKALSQIEEGFIYILKSENGYYKIGKAKELQNRITTWQHEFPIVIDFIYSFACHNRRLVENFLHNKYSKKRLRREWYKLNDEDIAWILSIKDYELG